MKRYAIWARAIVEGKRLAETCVLVGDVLATSRRNAISTFALQRRDAGHPPIAAVLAAAEWENAGADVAEVAAALYDVSQPGLSRCDRALN